MTHDDHMETITDPATVCITHGRFIPCRAEPEHAYTSNPFWVKSVRDFQGSPIQGLTWEPATVTITDPAAIRATDEPCERGDFPCCTTPAPVSGAGPDLDAIDADHFVTVDLEGFSPGDRPNLICKAPVHAMCHAIWTCECEWWCKDGVEDGNPWHDPSDFSEAEGDRHVGKFDPTECNLRDWAENSDECLRGNVTLAVTVEHMGDHVIFHAMPAEAEVVTLRDTLGRRTVSHTQLVRDNDTLRARLAAVEAVAERWEADASAAYKRGHSKVARSLHAPALVIRAALATTGEGSPIGANRADTRPLAPDATPDDTERCGGEGQ